MTSKSTHFLPADNNIPILRIERQPDKIDKVSKPSKHRAVKKLKIEKSFSKQHNFLKNKVFFPSQYFLPVYLHKSMYKNELFR